MQALASATMAQPSPLKIVWNTQRAKIFAGVLLIFALVALFLMFDTDLFFVYDLQINGTHYLSTDEIQKASGIMQYNIFFVNSRDVEHALTKLPEVKSTRVNTIMPNQVIVDVEERKPEITWLRGNESFWIDSDGISFRARKNLPELPSVRDLDQSPVKLGQSVKLDALAAFWAFRAAYPDGPHSFEWSAARGLAFTDERGWKIYMGDAEEMAGKIAKLRALTAQLIAQNAKIKFIDLGKGDPYYQ
jgi:cell division septal protein FtsQ